MICFKPHVTTLVATALTFLALICDLIGLVAPAWFTVRLGEKGEAKVGLWDYCFSQPKYDCQSVSQQFTVEAWLQASRAFAILGFLTLCLCVASCVCLCFASHILAFVIITPVSCLISTVLIFLEFAIFSGDVERVKNRVGQQFRYHYAFGLTVVAFVLLIPATVLHFVGNVMAADSVSLREASNRLQQSSKRKVAGEEAFESDMPVGEIRVKQEPSWGFSDRRSRERDLNRSRESDYSHRELNRSRDANRSRDDRVSRDLDATREFEKSFDKHSNV